MKIKTFKYIILYIILILLSIFLVKNFSNLSNYIKNYIALTQLENLKNKKEIEITNAKDLLNNIDIKNTKNIKTNFEKLMIIQLIDSLEKWNLTWIDYKDISNLYIITNQLNKAEKIIKNKNEYGYQDFYNLWNIYFLKSYEKFKNNWTWYIENIQNTISYYNYALETIPDYKRKDFIINNDNLAKDFLSYLYFYECNQFFIKLIKKNTNLLNLLDKLEQTLKRQIKQLNKWEQYDEIKNCIRQFESDAVKNLSIIADNKTFFQETKKWIVSLLKYYVDDSEICYKNKKSFESKYYDSLNSSERYFNDFSNTQNNLLKVFDKANLSQIKKLCENKDKLAKKQKKKNKNMTDNYKDLQDLMNNKKKRKKKKPEKPWKKENWNWDKKKYNKTQDQKNIEKEAKDIIKKVQERKTKSNYTPMNYINHLFKGFYWNKDDFINFDKKNSIGK